LAVALGAYAVYVTATLSLGLRFSNLTNRGIVATGPYRFVRHPAYAAKNLAWWAGMLPWLVATAGQRDAADTAWLLIGMVAMTSMYLWRASTEERHLGADPAYAAYRGRVRWRFIPHVV
jgi:protein-S-isoprenylcysteine O-methyltransferase Ste14